MSAPALLEATTYAVLTDEGGWRVAGSRVSLDSVIYGHLEGLTPQGIVELFPSLSLEQVHGAIAFYLRNRVLLDEYLRSQQDRWRELQEQSAAENRDLRERILQRAAAKSADRS